MPIAKDTPLIREQAAPGVRRDSSTLKLDCKFLDVEGIICNKRYPIEVCKSILYYELVEQIYSQLIREEKHFSFSSLELFSHTGYPLANSPSAFVSPISDWFLRENELIYASPKSLGHKYELVSDVDAEETLVSLQLRNSTLTVSLPFYKEREFVCDIKRLLSLRLHIPFSCVSIWQFNKSKAREETVLDNASISMSSVHKQKLCFSISDAYSPDTGFLSSFHTRLYTSCVPHDTFTWYHFNALLLYLVREHQGTGDIERLKQRLGLLRKVSCSTPLVYSLFLLFSGAAMSLPHRVAINEGLVTTIALLTTDSMQSPPISYFPQLWMHLEEHASPEHALSEIYDTTFISNRTQQNPRNEETRRLVKAFPPTQDSLITWKDSPSCHEAYRYTPVIRLEEFSPAIRFVLLHPLELYKRFLKNRVANGLMLPLEDKLSSPCVFMGRTRDRYGYFDYFSTEDGKCYSYNPHEIDISRRLDIPNRMSYPKILIILDISSDMNLSFLEYTEAKPPDEPNLVMTQVDTALILIGMLVDRLVGMESKFLLGAMVISNDHNFFNGFKYITEFTLEYGFVLRQLIAFVEKHKRKVNYNSKRLPDGIILKAVSNCIDLYSSQSRQLRTQIFLFTNGSTSKYYGAKVNAFEYKLHNSRCVLSNIIVSEQDAHELEKLSKLSKGLHINRKYIINQIPQNQHIEFATLLFLEYGSAIQDMLCESAFDSGTYNYLSLAFSGSVITTEELFEKCQREKEEYQKGMLSQGNMDISLHILRKVSAYVRSPNPFCKLYPLNNEIVRWLLFIQGPVLSPFDNSLLILEISFSGDFPLFPPKLRFLTNLYHPNVTRGGQVCHPILSEDYTPAVPLRRIIDSVHSMLSVLIVSHAVRYKVIEISKWHVYIYRVLVTEALTIAGVSGKTIGDIEQDFKIKLFAHTYWWED